MFLNLLLPYNIFLVWKHSNLRFSFIIVVTCSNTLLISPCCSYYQLQLCVGPRGKVFGEIKQSTIYATFGERSCKHIGGSRATKGSEAYLNFFQIRF